MTQFLITSKSIDIIENENSVTVLGYVKSIQEAESVVAKLTEKQQKLQQVDQKRANFIAYAPADIAMLYQNHSQGIHFTPEQKQQVIAFIEKHNAQCDQEMINLGYESPDSFIYNLTYHYQSIKPLNEDFI